jgi:hypothetical protein
VGPHRSGRRGGEGRGASHPVHITLRGARCEVRGARSGLSMRPLLACVPRPQHCRCTPSCWRSCCCCCVLASDQRCWGDSGCACWGDHPDEAVASCAQQQQAVEQPCRRRSRPCAAGNCGGGGCWMAPVTHSGCGRASAGAARAAGQLVGRGWRVAGAASAAATQALRYCMPLRSRRCRRGCHIYALRVLAAPPGVPGGGGWVSLPERAAPPPLRPDDPARLPLLLLAAACSAPLVRSCLPR